jgi:hypothetical protein
VFSLVILVLWKNTVGYLGYGRLPVPDYHFPDVEVFSNCSCNIVGSILLPYHVEVVVIKQIVTGSQLTTFV